MAAPQGAGAGKLGTHPTNETQNPIEGYKVFAKGSSRPYPGPNGQCLFTGGRRDLAEKDCLNHANVAESRNSSSSELCHRIDYGISMTSASALEARHLMNEYFGRAPPGGGTGCREGCDVFASGEGRRFMKAAEFLKHSHLSEGAQSPPEEIRTAVVDFYRFVTGNRALEF